MFKTTFTNTIREKNFKIKHRLERKRCPNIMKIRHEVILHKISKYCFCFHRFIFCGLYLIVIEYGGGDVGVTVFMHAIVSEVEDPFF